jgi:uncharacterized RDD family membrane protein YckC
VGQEYWRQEVISRVRQHRARRRRVDPNALELDFQAEPPLTIASVEEAAARRDTCDGYEASSADHLGSMLEDRPAERHPRKVIRFPAPALIDQEAGPDMELAQPSSEKPRILDAQEPEQIDLIPSFADICLEESPADSLLADDDLNLPGEPAPLGRRLISGLVDAVIVLAGLTTFAAGVTAALTRLAETVPHSRPVLLCALAAGATLALVFQYLFLVYGKGTPGMLAGSLVVLNFDGQKPSRAARGWRAVATTLSGVSLGLGFVWALVDEHTLGWHDRISGTYLKSGDRVIGSSGDLR